MPGRDRQRALARAKLERQMARRAASARKRRQVIAGIGAFVGLAVIAAAAILLINKFGGDDKKETAGGPVCGYQNVAATENVKDVGKPSSKDVPDSGTKNVTIATNKGEIKFAMDLEKVPCTANSWNYLASKQFFDNTICPRMSDGLVQCGNPFGDGAAPLAGGPSYEYGTENLPVGLHPAYPRGTVAMAKGEAPISVGSQFFIMLADDELTPDYTVVGKVSEESLAVLDAIKAVGNDGSFNPSPGGGKPNQTITISTLRVE